MLLALVIFKTVSFGQLQATTTAGKKVLLFENGTWLYADSFSLNNSNTTKIAGLEIPKTTSKDKVISHTGYSLLFNNTHKQATWVAYELTKDETNKIYDRTDKFIPDPKVKTTTSFDGDYKSSGYDRGHLAPASDMGWSLTAMSESFYYSNMSPQAPSFNRGIWKKLEEQVRTWAVENESIYVVTGPVLTNKLESIGPNKISVPKYYYKVLLDYTLPNIKGIGFILPNEASKEELYTFAVTIDSVEQVTGLDFFPLLQNNYEDQIESTNCIACWTWGNENPIAINSEIKTTQSTQCKGITKAGNRCKNKTTNASGYCYHHVGQQKDAVNENKSPQTNIKPNNNQEKKSSTVQCSGTTKAGNRCKRMTSNASGRCYQH